LKFWSDWKGLSKRRVVHGPGKTREEMVREARAAYRRRDEESAQQRKTLADAQRIEGNRRGERSWWEAADTDGAVDISMSPVPEEESNPTEDTIMSSTDEESKKLDFDHSENASRNPQILWDLSEPVSPVSGEGSSSA
jgi:G protein-coupled receptor GPR1